MNETADQQEVERAIGKLFIAVSNAQTVTIAAIAAMSGESDQAAFKRLWKAEFRKIGAEALRLVEARVTDGPEKAHLLDDLRWMIDASGEFWSLRNDLAHGSIYLHGNTGRWAVGRPFADNGGPTDRKRFIEPDVIERFQARVWSYIGAVSGVILYATGRAVPASDVILTRARLHGTYVTLVFHRGRTGA